MVTAQEVEAIVRRVVREELVLLFEALNDKPEAPQKTAECVPPLAEDWPGPFLLNDRELAQVEQLLPEAERPILRQRVMAARLAAKGNHASANRMRRRADNFERQLQERAREK